MADPMAEFLGKADSDYMKDGQWVGGSFACQECGEVVDQAMLVYEEKLLKWVCSKKHPSRIGMNV